MQRIILLIIVMLYTLGSCWAQSIKQQEAIADDFIPLFKDLGYEVYSFDISEFGKDSATYHIQPIVRHYVGGKEEEYTNYGITFPNRDDDAVYNKITVNLSPDTKGLSDKPNVEVKIMSFNLSGYKIGLPLYFEKQASADGEENTLYESRPFKLDDMKIGEFTPLVLYGSAWYDSDSGIFRFCGENKISPDMHEDILKDIPEFYVIGVIIK